MTLNIKKIAILFVLLFLLSGCSINYEINIDKDKKLNDKISLEVSNEVSSLYYDNPREYLEYMFKQKTIEFGLPNYIPFYNIENENSKIEINYTHDTVDSYFNSGIVKVLFKNVSVTKKGNDTIIKLNGMKDIFGEYDDLDYMYYAPSFNIVLKSEYIIKDSNADERNFFKGNYTWKMSKDSLNKNIELTISNKKNYFAIINGKLGLLVVPTIILIISILAYIIYLLINQKIKRVNQL